MRHKRALAVSLQVCYKVWKLILINRTMYLYFNNLQEKYNQPTNLHSFSFLTIKLQNHSFVVHCQMWFLPFYFFCLTRTWRFFKSFIKNTQETLPQARWAGGDLSVFPKSIYLIEMSHECHTQDRHWNFKTL